MKSATVLTLTLILASAVRALPCNGPRCRYSLEPNKTTAVFHSNGLTAEDRDAVRVLTYDTHICGVAEGGYTLRADDFADFPNLEELHTKDIGITSFQPSSKLSDKFTIKVWIASNNTLSSIDADFVFTALRYVTKIDLSSNLFTSITTRWLDGFRKLEKVDFSNNRISHIDSDAFQSFPNLTHVDLSNNNIAILIEHRFTTNNKLRYLNLFGNHNLKHFSYNIFSMDVQQPVEVHLPNNSLQNLDASCNGRRICPFNGFNEGDVFNNLKVFNAAGNLRSVEELLFCSEGNLRLSRRNLKILDLSGNKIDNFTSQMIAKFEHLTNFSLCDVNLTSLANLTFSKNTKLKYLNLSHNRIGEAVDLNQFKELNLDVLDLSSNRIENVCSRRLCNNTKVYLSKNNYTCDFLDTLSRSACDVDRLECCRGNAPKGCPKIKIFPHVLQPYEEKCE